MGAHRQNSATDDRRRRETAELVGRLRDVATDEERRRIRQQLVILNVPVATGIALRYRGRGESVEDLVQTAHLGLVKAVNGFDPRRGQDLLAYAVPTISGEIKRHFRDLGWGIRPPRRVQELRGAVGEASSTLAQRLGRSPRISEIAAFLGACEDDVVECVASADLYHVYSLDAPTGRVGDIAVGETLGEIDPLLARIEDVLSLRPLLDRLSRRDRRVLALRFFRGWTQQQIADDVGVTQMQISRVLDHTLRRLREEITAA
jgi:RNA polymerase sigma-B factor